MKNCIIDDILLNWGIHDILNVFVVMLHVLTSYVVSYDFCAGMGSGE